MLNKDGVYHDPSIYLKSKIISILKDDRREYLIEIIWSICKETIGFIEKAFTTVIYPLN